MPDTGPESAPAAPPPPRGTGMGKLVLELDPQQDMDRLIALGVDDLITNEPAEALRRVRAYQELSSPERTLLQVHAWLAQ